MDRPEGYRDFQTDEFVRITHREYGETARGVDHAIFGQMFPGLMALIILAGILFLLSIVVMYAQHSGILRYILLTVAITLIGGALAWVASRNTADPVPLGWASAVSEEGRGDLARMTRLLERGQDGMGFSQLQVVDRLRAAFLEKWKVTRNLTDAEAQSLLKDPERLMENLGDREIASFLLDAEDARRRWSQIIVRREPVLRSSGSRVDFAGRMARLVELMEGWT
jgi:hypothetical protein